MRPTPESLSETIVARATPPGVGAVAIVRLSGKRALEIGRALAPRARPSPRRLQVARLLDREGRALDEALVAEMPGPASFTGEDTTELYLHGAPIVAQTCIDRACELGARLASPGEFTLRAFLNGRIDLAQAEGVATALAAQSVETLYGATNVVVGELSKPLTELLSRLEVVLADWRTALDFPEHDTGAAFWVAHSKELHDCVCKLQGLVASSRSVASQSGRVVLCGAPNVGKSSLLNAWTGQERVLVDAIAGTTRDPVEVHLADGWSRWSVCDTAGLRGEAEGLEARGIELSRQWIGGAQLALWLLDPLAPSWPDVGLGVDAVLGTKADLVEPQRRVAVEAEVAERGFPFVGWVSVKTGEGVSAARDVVQRLAAGEGEAKFALQERQLEGLKRAEAALVELTRLVAANESTLDVWAGELETVVHELGALLGRDVEMDVLETIFARFCIGK